MKKRFTEEQILQILNEVRQGQTVLMNTRPFTIGDFRGFHALKYAIIYYDWY